MASKRAANTTSPVPPPTGSQRLRDPITSPSADYSYGSTPTDEMGGKIGASGLFGSLSGAALPSPTKFCPMQRRYYLALMAFLGFCNVYALRVNLSIAILQMVKENVTVELPDGTMVEKEIGEFAWSSVDQGVILAAFFYGYIIPQIPGGWLASRYGGRTPFGLSMIGAGVLCLLTPVLAPVGSGSIYPLVVVRFLQGLSQGFAYPSAHALFGHWAPPLEKTKMVTLAFSGSYFGTVIAMPIAAALAEHSGWRSVFYFFGTVSLVWAAVWFLTVAETPAKDPRIQADELRYIQTSVGFSFDADHTKAGGDTPTPWVKMFTSLPVWAIVVAHAAENWGFYTMLTFLPKFIQDATGTRLEKNGLITAVPYLFMGILIVVGGWSADYLRRARNWETVLVRKAFNCGGFLVQAVFIVATAYARTPSAAVVLVTVAVAGGGLAWSGFSVNHLDLAPQYAGVLMGISNTFATIPGMVSPVVVGAIVQHHFASEWERVFWIVAGAYIIGAVFYGIFAAGTTQAWANSQGLYATHLDDVVEGVQQRRPADVSSSEAENFD